MPRTKKRAPARKPRPRFKTLVVHLPAVDRTVPPGEYSFKLTTIDRVKGGYVACGHLIRCMRCSQPAMAGRTCCAEHDPGEPPRACGKALDEERDEVLAPCPSGWEIG
jgi:hypothetical protein